MWSAKKDGAGWIIEHMNGAVLIHETRWMHRKRPVTFKSREAAERRAAEMNEQSN